MYSTCKQNTLRHTPCAWIGLRLLSSLCTLMELFQRVRVSVSTSLNTQIFPTKVKLCIRHVTQRKWPRRCFCRAVLFVRVWPLGLCVCGIGAFSGRPYYGWLGNDNNATTSEPRLHLRCRASSQRRLWGSRPSSVSGSLPDPDRLFPTWPRLRPIG